MSGNPGGIPSELVASVMGSVMESMVFSEVALEDDDGTFWGSSSLVWACVELVAPSRGQLWLAAELEDAVDMVDAVWGGAIPGTAESARSLLAELVNTVAGQVLADLDPDCVVEMGLPETGEGGVAQAAVKELRSCFVLDDGTSIGVVVHEAA